MLARNITGPAISRVIIMKMCAQYCFILPISTAGLSGGQDVHITHKAEKRCPVPPKPLLFGIFGTSACDVAMFTQLNICSSGVSLDQSCKADVCTKCEKSQRM